MKKLVRLTESELHNIVSECVKNVLKEDFTFYVGDSSLSAMEKAFSTVLGSDILSRGVKVLRGKILPQARYHEGRYVWNGNDLFSDAIIEYPDGRKCSLTKK